MTDEGAPQLERLHEGVVGLRSRARSSGLPDRWLLVTGGVLLPLGLGLIVLGWYGSAQTTLEFEQTPYLISGGLLGLALAVTGALLYGIYWLTLLVRDGRARDVRDAAHQERVELALQALAAAQRTASRATAAPLVVTAGGTMLHRPDCAATQGQSVRRAGSQKGLALCGLCRPERVRS